MVTWYYALKPENEGLYALKTSEYAILNQKNPKHALCMNFAIKRPKYANMHGKNMVIWNP